MYVLVMLFAGHLLVFDNSTGKPYPFNSKLACEQLAKQYLADDKTDDEYKLACVTPEQLSDLVKANAPKADPSKLNGA